jgi:phosphoribosylaminoimidazole-succinocarboxamide synthase
MKRRLPKRSRRASSSPTRSFEFGLDRDGTLTLMDEVLTPDSSRFWPVEGYAEGINPPSYDKQFRPRLARAGPGRWQAMDKRAPPPTLPADVVGATAARYREALDRLMGPG